MNEIQAVTTTTDTTQDPDELVELKNGAKVLRAHVKSVTAKLYELTQGRDTGAILLHELVMKSRDKQHALFDGCGRRLLELGFLNEEGSVKGYVRDIVLSSAKDEGLELSFISPLR